MYVFVPDLVCSLDVESTEIYHPKHDHKSLNERPIDMVSSLVVGWLWGPVGGGGTGGEGGEGGGRLEGAGRLLPKPVG